MRGWILLIVTGLCGCVATTPPVVLPNTPPTPPVVAAPPPPPVVEIPPVSESPIASIEWANQAALLTPRRAWFIGHELRYPVLEHATYRIDTAPLRTTALLLAPGEAFLWFDLADTTRWTKTHAMMGQGDTARVVILLKPHAPGLRTTATLLTSWALYQLDVHAHQRTSVLRVSWVHPPKPTIAHWWTATPSQTRYSLTVEAAVTPPWMPRTVWDTGLGGKTFIELPAEASVYAMPVLYARHADGTLERVNHRLIGPTRTILEVDRLSHAWQLQDGPDGTGAVVRLEQAR